MAYNPLYPYLTDINFTVQNVSPQRKRLTVFGAPIEYLQTRNLLRVDGVTEDIIRASLVKGELSNKIRVGALKIVSTSINLLQFDESQKEFIDSANVIAGDSLPGTDPITQCGGGGGGATVIPDGGTLSGTYNGNVLCEGAATVVGEVIVNGNLTCLGTLTNSGRHQFLVIGDLHAFDINFTSDDPLLPQGNFGVSGNLYFINFNFTQSGSSSALLVVGGNLVGINGISGSVLNGYGLSDTIGLNVLVYGDLNVSNVLLYGGEALLDSGGSGGSITVYGDANIAYQLYMHGGDSSIDGFSAGNGGSLEVYGNLTVGESYYDIKFNGGDSINGGNAGNGGSLHVYGNCVLNTNDTSTYSVVFDGGDCTSNNENYRSGSAGNITVDGNLNALFPIYMIGGNRDGNLASINSLTPPDGGNIIVNGDAIIFEIDCTGGEMETSGNACGNAGSGGDITVKGNLTVDTYIHSTGADNSNGVAGSGGNINVNGNLIAEDEIQVFGGKGNRANSGESGDIDVKGNLTCSYIDAYGGDGVLGNGGNGGNITTKGNLYVGDYIYTYGGNCNSTNNTHIAGNGGNVGAKYIHVSNEINISAGDRSGMTLITNTGVGSPNSGNIDCEGDLITSSIIGNGCSCTTNFPNCAGSKGSNIYADGNVIVDYIEINGGNSVGNNAGNGGEMYISGYVRADNIQSNGGNANNSAGVGSDAGVNGAGGNTLKATHGFNVKTDFSVIDGTGPGSVPTNNIYINLSGSNHIRNLTVADRPGVVIRPDGPATLKVKTMSEKNTLNDSSGSTSVDISADVDSHIYISDGDTWYGIAGTTIFT